jgi:hypothetical protein
MAVQLFHQTALASLETLGAAGQLPPQAVGSLLGTSCGLSLLLAVPEVQLLLCQLAF